MWSSSGALGSLVPLLLMGVDVPHSLHFHLSRLNTAIGSNLVWSALSRLLLTALPLAFLALADECKQASHLFRPLRIHALQHSQALVWAHATLAIALASALIDRLRWRSSCLASDAANPSNLFCSFCSGVYLGLVLGGFLGVHASQQ